MRCKRPGNPSAFRGEWQAFDSATLTLAAKSQTATHKRTFRSKIDGSVQYFTVVPEKLNPVIGIPETTTADEQNANARDPKEEQPGSGQSFSNCDRRPSRIQ